MEERWDIEITPAKGWWDLDLKGLWQYRDLVKLLVRRDIVAVYKQTVLGPIWHVVQPLTTTLTFTLVFGLVARLSPEGIPAVLFYMSGIVTWGFFAGIVNKTSKTFIGNSNLMTKVYFPRLVVPVSTTISNLVGFGIQLATFLGFLLVYHFWHLGGFTWHPGPELLLFPFLVLLMALLGLGVGIIVSAMTTKYRDLSFLVGFGVQLLMYLSPVIFPLSLFEQHPAMLMGLKLNPMTPVIESTRTMFFGGTLDWGGLSYTAGVAAVLMVVGAVLFHRVERSFADIV